MEYMYGGTEGLAFTLQSIQALRKHDVELALPSHGEPITEVAADIDRLQRRIMDAVELGRGLKVGGWDSPLEAPFLPGVRAPARSRRTCCGAASGRARTSTSW